MDFSITGVDHVTAFTSDAEANIAFYQGILDLDLVRKERQGTSHEKLYYKDREGQSTPFLKFVVDPTVAPPKPSGARVRLVALEVATAGEYEDAFDYWGDRLDDNGIYFWSYADQPTHWCRDPDGLMLEIVISWGENDPEGPIGYVPGEHVPSKYRLTAVEGAMMESPTFEQSASFMTENLGFKLSDPRPTRKAILNFLDRTELRWKPPSEEADDARVHHVSLGCSADDLVSVQGMLVAAGVELSPLTEDTTLGQRFFSFREPGGLIFGVFAPIGDASR